MIDKDEVKTSNKPKKKKAKTNHMDPVLLERQKTLSALLSHPRNANIIFKGRGFRYVDAKKELMLTGLTTALKRVFWPDYEYEESAYRRKGTGVSSAAEGKDRGTYVHNQIMDYINTPAKKFKAKHDTLHPYTKKAIIGMRKWKLTACQAEFAIFDLRSMIGSRLDAILLDEFKKFTVVDWKCGFDDYLLKGNGMLKGPVFKDGMTSLSDYSNSPLHQGFLQLLIEKKFLEAHYSFQVDNLYIMQIAQDGIYPYAVPAEFIENIDLIYDYLCEGIKRYREKKKLINEMKRQTKKKIERAKKQKNKIRKPSYNRIVNKRLH